MSNIKMLGWVVALCITFATTLPAQTDTLVFDPFSRFEYSGTYSAYSARFDRLGRPFLYAANKELGLIIFDISNPAQPSPIDTFKVQQFQNLKVTDVYQQGEYLYASLGDFEGFFPQSAGLAILNVSDPGDAFIAGQWDSTAFNKGSAAVRVDGDFAYLGAMEKGLIVLNVADKGNPQFVSGFVPDPNWPAPPGLFSIPHVRGIAVQGDLLWMCYDAGGLRAVSVADKQNPVEIGRYLNSGLDLVAQPAYNNAVVAGHYLLAAVDYCGLDVADISDPADPHNAAWVNPWNCDNTNWDGRPGHTNQLVTARHDSLLFISGADSEVLAFDIANPAVPQLLGQFGMLHDSIVSWGVDATETMVALALVDNPVGTPYVATRGIRLLEWNYTMSTAAGIRPGDAMHIHISPNPFHEGLTIRYFLSRPAEVQWSIFDCMGRLVNTSEYVAQEYGERTQTVFTDALPDGVYCIRLSVQGQSVGVLGVKME